MKLWSSSITDGAPINGAFAFAVQSPQGHIALSHNRNPHLAWSGAPKDTRSFVLLCHDPDVPSHGEDVNKEGRTVPADLPRVDFFHWVMIDIPPDVSEIAEGSMSDCITPRGKPGGGTDFMRQGINDYTGWFAGDPQMAGDYHGYDGPCPPWNDERPHRYIFTLYALSIAHLPLSGRFDGHQVRQAITAHTIAEASISGRYTLNPSVAL